MVAEDLSYFKSLKNQPQDTKQQAGAKVAGLGIGIADSILQSQQVGSKQYGDIGMQGFNLKGTQVGLAVGANPLLMGATGGLSAPIGAALGLGADALMYQQRINRFKQQVNRSIQRSDIDKDYEKMLHGDTTGLMRKGGAVVDPPKKTIKIQISDGSEKEVDTNSDEYKKLYDSGAVGSMKGDLFRGSQSDLPEFTVSAQKPLPSLFQEYNNKIIEENRGAGLEAMFTVPLDYVASAPQLLLTKLMSGKVQRPSEALDIKNPVWKFATDAVIDPFNIVSGVEIAKAAGKVNSLADAFRVGKMATREVANMVAPVDAVVDYAKLFRPKNFDIHDVRLKYHNMMVLQPEEIALLQKEGKGNPSNYKNAKVKDVGGRHLLRDVDLPPLEKGDIVRSFMGEKFDNIPEDVPIKTEIATNENPNKIIFEKENIIEKPKEVELKYGIYPGEYERSDVSRKADKWLSDWYDTPESKQKFMDYGGTEEQWQKVLDSLENPIKSNFDNYGKNQPAGAYFPGADQATIPRSANIGVGTHEGAHKTKIVLGPKRTMLKKLYNDLADVVHMDPVETYAEIARMRTNMDWTPKTTVDEKMLEEGLKSINNYYHMPWFIRDKNKFLEILNKAPALIPAVGIGKALYDNANKSLQEGSGPRARFGGQIKPQLKSLTC